jgi:hypothetical protein
MPLQIRRGTNSQRLAMTEPLASGELLYTTDTGSLYIGNGTSLGGVPLSNLTPGDIKDLSASIFQTGVHSGITFNYNTISKTMDAIVEPDLSNYAGTIRADAFQGNLIAENSTLIFNSIDGSINLDGTVQGDIIPDDNATYDIGSSTFRFKDIYLSGSSIHLGNAIITASGSAVNLPAGSTVNGTPIGSGGSGTGIVEGNGYNIHIIGDDSTIMVNAATRTLTAVSASIGTLTGTVAVNILNGNQFNGTHNGSSFGTHYGAVQGNVIGNVTGVLTGDVRGNVLAEDSTVLVDYTNGTTGGTHVGNVVGTILGDTYGTHFGDVTGNVNGNLKGSVFAQDSTTLVDAIGGKIVGDVDSDNASFETVLGKTIVLQGTSNLGVKAGIRINTDGDLNDGYDLFTINGAKGTADGTVMSFIRSRGTLSSPAPLQVGDVVNTLVWFGSDSGSNPAPMAGMNVTVDGTPTAGYIPSRMNFSFWNGTGFDTALSFGGSDLVLNVKNNTLTAGGGSGQVNVGGGAVSYLKIKVGSTFYALPLYGINP